MLEKLRNVRWPESRALKYGYANARMKALKGVLLSPSTLDELIRVQTIAAMIELLQRTPYKEDLVELALRYRGAKLVELATQRRFLRTARRILRITPKNDRPIVKALLKKWDLLIVRMILNARRAGTPLEDIRPYIQPIDPAYEKEFGMLAETDDVFGAFRRTGLGHEVMQIALPPGGVLQRFQKAVTSGDALMQLQLMLETYLYEYSNRALAGSAHADVRRIHAIFQKEIDARNVVTAEKMKEQGKTPEDMQTHRLRGGTFSDHQWDRLTRTKKVTETVEWLEGRWGKLGEGITNAAELEIALERALARQKVKAFHRSILSIGTLLGAVLLLEEEMHNLRKIAKAKEFGLGEDEVRKTLVVV